MSGAPGLCVAMCSYDGARHLQAQLDSIAGQTRRPDRMVVVDDCSRDETPRILAEFARKAPFPVEVVINRANLGYVRNFEKAVSLCPGGLIVLSDQDDVWLPNRLARLEAAFAGQPGVDAFFSDARMVDAQRRPYPYTLWEAIRFEARERQAVAGGRAFEVLIRRNVVTGATLAFRSSALARLLPFPECWHHDEWVAMVIAATGRLGMIDEPLIEYRQHDRNQLGARRLGLGARLRSFTRRSRFDAREVEKFERLRAHLAGVAPAPERMPEIDRKIEHARARAALPSARWRRIGPVLAELRRDGYARYARGWRSALGDLLESF